MKIKKLIASILVVMVALTAFSSFSVSAQGIKLDKGLTYASVVSAELETQIVKAVASNEDFEITLQLEEINNPNIYTKRDIAEPSKPLEISMAINGVERKVALGNNEYTAVFKFDKMGKTGNIIISTNRDIVIADYNVKAIRALAAGAPCYEIATAIIGR